jgi:putative Holliday junction resolvase
LRLIGLDVGDRRIGVALSGPNGLIATPLTYLHSAGKKRDIAYLLTLAEHHGAEGFVVGLPLLLSGEVGPQAKRVLAFVEALRAASSLPVETWDERLSTVEAQQLMREAGRQPSREKGNLDAAAAAVILQSYLDTRQPQEKSQG